ncbi:MAG: hypothetical protein ACD_62C00094G0005, partial [uncultured bacterium]
IVGAGGGGFPAHIKLKASVDTVLANGSECEPLLNTDKTLMIRHADQVVTGVALAMKTTGAKQGIIAVKGHYTDVVNALTKALDPKQNIHIHKLQNYYPAGDEFLTVYDATKRIIPEGGLPLNVGVVVSNVLSLYQMTDAVNGKPVTERMVTITGEVEKPCVVKVPIGTPYTTLLALAGRITTDNPVVIDGGPMMGNIVDDLSLGIAKTCSGVLVLPRDHFVVRAKTLSVGQMIKLSKAACCQCFRCTDLCPRNLLGHAIFPHATMRTIDYNLSEPTQNITSAFLCSQCGMCEMVACDVMRLSPKKIYAAYRRELVAKGVKNPHNSKPTTCNSAYEDRKVAIDVLLKKLDLLKYKKETPYLGYQNVFDVIVPLHRHVGAKSLPVVKQGQTVSLGDLIAPCPAGALGTNYHASISGVVKSVSETTIEIQAQR